MRPISCFAGRLWCLQLLCSGKDQQRFSFSRKVRAQTNPQLRVSSLQKMAEDTFFLFFFFPFLSGNKNNKLNAGDKLCLVVNPDEQ